MIKLTNILKEINNKLIVDVDSNGNALFYFPEKIYYGTAENEEYEVSDTHNDKKLLRNLNLSGVRYEENSNWKIPVYSINPDDLKIRKIPGTMYHEVIFSPEQWEIFDNISDKYSDDYNKTLEMEEKFYNDVKQEQERYGLPRTYPHMNE